MIDPDYRRFVERVKAAAPIEEVVGARVAGLRQAGNQFKACCPFHQERTPSFYVTPARGTWHCFGACGEGGDAIRFLEKVDGLTFREAVEELARQYGVEIPKSTRDLRQQSARELAALEALERAQRLFARKLQSPVGQAAQRYLKERGLLPQTLESFGIGFAPGGNALVEAAKGAGFSEQALLDAGLARRREDGRLTDFFYARITIPIRDGAGRTVGFGARLLPGVEGPKYVNSPDSIVFHKGRLIFGLDLAKEAVRRDKRILLMEGYTDVMACHQVDLRTAVAVLGTATTEEHGRLLRKSGAKRATLVFDGDAAGRKAVLKALHGLLPLEGLSVDVVAPPEGLDPADVCQRDPGAMRRALEAPRGWFDFLLDGIVGLERDQRPAAIRDLLSVLRRLPSPVERENLLGAAAERLSLSVEALRAEGQRLQRSPGAPGSGAGESSAASQGTVRPPGPGRPQSDQPRGQRTARGSDRPNPEVGERIVEQRAWAELLGAMLVDNSLYPLHQQLLRIAFESPPFAFEAAAPTQASPGAPAPQADAAVHSDLPAAEVWTGDLETLSQRVDTCCWGADQPALRELLRLTVSLLEEANPGETVDLNLLFNYLDQEEERTLLGRCETIGRRSQEGNQLNGPAELAKGAGRALLRGWQARGLRLAEAALAASERGPEARLEFEHLLQMRRRRGDGHPGLASATDAAPSAGSATANRRVAAAGSPAPTLERPASPRGPDRPPAPATKKTPPALPRRPPVSPRRAEPDGEPSPEAGRRSWDEL
jgi:DNA primase